MYSKELVERYVQNRDEFRETDKYLFEPLAVIGIAKKDVLDFGCGDGGHAESLLKLGAQKVVGVDISQDMINLANQRQAPGLKFIVADGSKLPFADESFDIVFSNFVIHYFKDTHIPMKEISRVLKTNGYFIGTFNISEVKDGFENLYNTNMPIRLGRKSNNVIVQNLIKSKDEIHSAFDKSGLNILVEKELDHPNAVIDESFEHIEKIKKNAMLFVAQKII